MSCTVIVRNLIKNRFLSTIYSKESKWVRAQVWKQMVSIVSVLLLLVLDTWSYFFNFKFASVYSTSNEDNTLSLMEMF